MPHYGRGWQRGRNYGPPKQPEWRWVEWSAPSRGRRTLLYRRSLHRAVAIDPDTHEWWAADLQPWTVEGHRGLEVALRSRLPAGSMPDEATTELAVAVLRGEVSLDDAARDLCLALRELELPDENERPWVPLPRPNFT